VAFWYLSILGGTMLLSYAIYRQDVVFILGQSMGLIVYVRNLALIRRVRKADKIAAAQAASAEAAEVDAVHHRSGPAAE
jgi:lipid-A-disaccharide synthase-like uncharacterized protein